MSDKPVSLLDVAKSMAAPAPEPTPTPQPSSLAAFAKSTAQELTAKPALTLLDVAKEQEQTAKVSLMDVARTEVAQIEQEKKAAVRKSLHYISQEINDEESERVAKALDTTTQEVKAEIATKRLSVLQEAVAEIQHEEAQAAQALKQRVETQEKTKPVHEEDEDQGYSSFEDDEQPAKEKKSHKKWQLEDDDNQSTNNDENAAEADPVERTTISEAPESKVFLRKIYRGDLWRVREMIEKEDMDVNVADQHGWSALHWAVSQDHIQIGELLIKQGAHVNTVDHMNHWSPLHVAVIRGAIASAKILLEAGAKIQSKDLYGDSPLDCVQALTGKRKLKLQQLMERYQHTDE